MNSTSCLAAQFQVGDVVDVKNHGRATVLAVVCDASNPHFGRCLVQYHEDGTQFHCNPLKLRKLKLVGAVGLAREHGSARQCLKGAALGGQAV